MKIIDSMNMYSDTMVQSSILKMMYSLDVCIQRYEIICDDLSEQ